MEKKPFKEHRITRSCDKELKPYGKYRPYLEKDFRNRCCYCNMSAELITSPFHVDHFIPKKVFEGKKDYLLTQYDNLMWSCPKCNMSKGDSYEGDLENDDSITNELFYNPVEVDYNDIFYRNKYGQIRSDDPKGQEMIKKLKLYRTIHSAAWILERLEKTTQALDEMIKKEADEDKKKVLEKASRVIAVECVKMEPIFRTIYREKKFEEPN